MIYKIYDNNMLSSVSGGRVDRLNFIQKAKVLGLSTLLIVSPVVGLENSIEQSIGDTTKLQKRKSLFNRSDGSALIKLLERLGLITAIPWLTY